MTLLNAAAMPLLIGGTIALVILVNIFAVQNRRLIRALDAVMKATHRSGDPSAMEANDIAWRALRGKP